MRISKHGGSEPTSGSRSDAARSAVAVVLTGVPGAGKTTLGRALASGLNAPFLSLDATKEKLYERGGGDVEGYQLRLAAEAVLADRLAASKGPVVVDIWIAPGRDTRRVSSLLRANAADTVEVLCRVPADLAVDRYVRRVRGGPHRHADQDTLRRIRAAVDLLTPLGVGRCIEVDTSTPVDVGGLLRALGQWGLSPARGVDGAAE